MSVISSGSRRSLTERLCRGASPFSVLPCGKMRCIALPLEEGDDELPGDGTVHFADRYGPEEDPILRGASDETRDPFPE